MTRAGQHAARLIARHLAAWPEGERVAVLREIVSTASAGLASLEGPRPAAEFVFRIADALVGLEQ